MVTYVQGVVGIFAIIVVVIVLGFYLTKERKNPLNDSTNIDPTYKPVSVTQTVKIVHSETGENIDLRGLYPRVPDVTGKFNARWEGAGNFLPGSSGNFVERINLQTFTNGIHIYDYYPNGPADGLRNQIRLKDDKIKSQDDMIAYLTSVVEENGLEINAKILQEFEFKGAIKASPSLQGYSKIEGGKNFYKKVKGKLVRDTSSSEQSTADRDFYGDE